MDWETVRPWWSQPGRRRFQRHGIGRYYVLPEEDASRDFNACHG